MNIHTIILPYTPESIKEFFEDIAKIDDKIANDGDYAKEIKRVTDESEKTRKGVYSK